jgi:UDP-N-acetylglucosamine acyltransferase
MTAVVHPTAVVSPEAELASGVTVGPYAVIGRGVSIGRGTTVGANAHVEGSTRIGEDNRIFPHAAIGGDPQDLKYRGEPTMLVIGNRNTFREFATANRGTVQGHGQTVIGDDNFFMAYSHVAHDCRIGNRCVLANYVGLAGHVDVGDHAILGAFVGAHQFIRIGRHAFVGAYSQLRQDALPFCKTEGTDAKTYGLNVVGLRRSGFSRERLQALEQAYRLLVKSALNTTQALDRIREEIVDSPDVDELVAFIESSRRGIHR